MHAAPRTGFRVVGEAADFPRKPVAVQGMNEDGDTFHIIIDQGQVTVLSWEQG